MAKRAQAQSKAKNHKQVARCKYGPRTETVFFDERAKRAHRTRLMKKALANRLEKLRKAGKDDPIKLKRNASQRKWWAKKKQEEAQEKAEKATPLDSFEACCKCKRWKEDADQYWPAK